MCNLLSPAFQVPPGVLLPPEPLQSQRLNRIISTVKVKGTCRMDRRLWHRHHPGNHALIDFWEVYLDPGQTWFTVLFLHKVCSLVARTYCDNHSCRCNLWKNPLNTPNNLRSWCCHVASSLKWTPYQPMQIIHKCSQCDVWCQIKCFDEEQLLSIENELRENQSCSCFSYFYVLVLNTRFRPSAAKTTDKFIIRG